MSIYCLASSVNLILRCDELPERARCRYLARSGLPAVYRRKIVFFFRIINPLLTKLVQFRSLASFFVFVFMDLDSINTQKKNVVYSKPLYFTLGQ